jgi:predicted DCC family thiol-disulfide oxidoreductase YuxK
MSHNSTALFIKPAQAVLPLTIFYDHSCLLCRSEMLNLKARDNTGQLNLVDCSLDGFDTSAMPVTQTVLMNYIHAVDSQGQWLKGTDVFVVCYQSAGMGAIATAFAFGKPVLERLYPLVVKHRYTISKLGIHKVFNVLTDKQLARKAKKTMAATQGCKNERCDVK